MISAGLIFTLSLVVPAPPAQTEPAWIGKRVVQKYRDFSLTVNGEPVERNRFVIDIYQVERTDESLLWLKAETLGSSGWAKPQDVVPLDQALDFFTRQIEAKPVAPFFYTARALIWRQSSDFDKALRDYDQAIRLDPHTRQPTAVEDSSGTRRECTTRRSWTLTSRFGLIPSRH